MFELKVGIIKKKLNVVGKAIGTEKGKEIQ